MNKFRILILLCCFPLLVHILLPSPAFSKLYTWTDKSGKVRRTYYPPPDEYVLKSNSAQKARPAQQQTSQDNKVELYLVSWCPYCKKAREFFDFKGISYTAYDIEEDAKAATRKKQLDSKTGVPFAIVNGVKIHGYSPEMYSRALK